MSFEANRQQITKLDSINHGILPDLSNVRCLNHEIRHLGASNI